MKKIRIMAMFLAIVMCIGMFAGCGKADTQDPAGSVTGGNSKGDGGATKRPSKETPEKEKPAADNNDEKTGARKIIDGTLVYDGVAFIEVEERTEKGTDEVIYAVDMKNSKILYNFTEKTGLKHIADAPSWEDWEYRGSMMTYSDGVMVWENILYDKQGNIVASPEKNGYHMLISGAVNGYIFACKLGKDFSGDKLYFGVLNTKGEWVRELSAESAMADYLPEDLSLELENGTFSPSSQAAIRSWCRFYSTPDRSYSAGVRGLPLLENVQTFVGFDAGFYNKDYLYDPVNDVVYESYPYIGNSRVSSPAISRFASDGTEEVLLTGYQTFGVFEDAIFAISIGYTSNASKSLLISTEGDVIIDFKDYDITTVGAWTGEYFLCTVYNSSGETYACVFNKDGELMFEPVQTYTPYVRFWSGGFILLETVRDGNGSDCGTRLIAYDLKGKSKVLGTLSETINDIGFWVFEDGIIVVRNHDTYIRYINMNGEEIITLK